MQKFQQRPEEVNQSSPVQAKVQPQPPATLKSAGSVQRDKASPQESFADFQARLGVPVQAKLTVTPAGDKYEQEADAVADQVMQTMRVQRMDDEDMMMQRQTDFTGGGVVGSDVEADIQSARGGGQAMPDTVRSPLESAFGTDFSNVRVHADSQSDALNRGVQAKAFTTGNDIFFSKGTYSPQSESGQRLLAHELTHVVQQGAAQRKAEKE